VSKNCSHLFTKETEKRLFTETLLPCFLRGESVTAFWVRHAGRRRTGRFLVQNAKHLGFEALAKYKIINVPAENLIEKTPPGFFQLMLSCLNPETNSQSSERAFFVLKEEIEKLVGRGYHLIFILERFDELNDEDNFPIAFFNNLHALWSVDKTKIHFLFANSTDIFKSESFGKLGHLKEVISQNLIHFPLLGNQDNAVCLQTLIQKYGYKVSHKQLSLIKKLSGGHASLNRAALRILQNYYSTNSEKILAFLADQYEIKVILEDIWNSFDDEEKKSLIQINQGTSLKKAKVPTRLLNLGIVVQEKTSSKLFSPLLENFISNLKSDSPQISLEAKTGEILINGQPAKEKITLQEYHLLLSFLKKKNLTLSRDQIAQALWGKDFEEKYSDWAIDQVISKLRLKLEHLGISSQKLQTIRGRGYRWTE